MKRAIKLIVTGLVFTAGTIYAAGIPVVDGTAQGTRVQQFVKQVKEYEDALEYWRKEIERHQENINSITGLRDLGDLINTIEELKAQIAWLEGQFEDIQAIIDNPSAALSGEAGRLLERLQLYDNCADIEDDKMRDICYYEFKSQVAELSGYGKTLQDLSKSMNQIKTLNDKIKNSDDQKQSLDNIAAGIKLIVELETKRQMEELAQAKAAKQRETNDIVKRQIATHQCFFMPLGIFESMKKPLFSAEGESVAFSSLFVVQRL
jgi:predicted  nucleic acid-binding Zn-ribbon protein